MQNANAFTVKVEKEFSYPAHEVFRAIGEGRLFANCGADLESMKIDFQKGGKYTIYFKNYGVANHGQFLDVAPNSKIAFTWCQDASLESTPDTVVTILLNEVSGKTRVSVTHTGFRDQEQKNNHHGGWTGGLNDLASELIEGKLRFMRYYEVGVRELFEKLKLDRFEHSAELTAEAPAENLTFKLRLKTAGGGILGESTITLKIEADDESGSWLEVLHEGLTSEESQKNYRKKWAAYLGQKL